jgi:hypothetical protein
MTGRVTIWSPYLLAAGLSLVISGCSNTHGLPGDQGPDVDTSCGPSIYPCGPYGTKVGDKVLNMEFQGYMDPDEQCKRDSEKKHDTTLLRSISFKDYYLGSSKPGCSAFNKQLLWVMVSSGWCGSCQTEVNTEAGKYANDQWYPKVALLNVVVDNTTPNYPADAAFISSWASLYGVTFPVVMDPTFQMGRYLSRDSMPLNLLIDLRTMTIYYQQTGGKLSDVEDRANKFK